MYRHGFLVAKKFSGIVPYSVVDDPARSIQNPGLSGANSITNLIVPEHIRPDPSLKKKTSPEKYPEEQSEDQEGKGLANQSDTSEEDVVDESSSATSEEEEDEDPRVVRQKQIEKVKRSFQNPVKVKQSEVRKLMDKGDKANHKEGGGEKRKIGKNQPLGAKKPKKHNFKLV